MRSDNSQWRHQEIASVKKDEEAGELKQPRQQRHGKCLLKNRIRALLNNLAIGPICLICLMRLHCPGTEFVEKAFKFKSEKGKRYSQN